MIVLRNGSYLSPSGVFLKGDIAVEDGRIFSIGALAGKHGGCENYDMNGYKIVPGFIDIHTHGALGYDVMTASPIQLRGLSKFLVQNGVTSFLPTTITADMAAIKSALENIKTASAMDDMGASILGVHIEGPYINSKQKGCHEVSLIKPPEITEYEAFRSVLGDNLKLRITVAPEIPGAMEFIRYVSSRGDSITIGHTDADSKTVLEAVDNGAVSFTHLFNAMKGIHHREPGTVGAALSGDAYVELICDGIHLHPEIIKMVHKTKGIDKILLVTDAMNATGLGDGYYEFGGFTIKVADGIARQGDGTLAGSTLTLMKAVKNMMRFTGIAFEEAVRMATINPARAIGMDDLTGSIELGKLADFVIVNDDLNIVAVFSKGRQM